MGPIHRAKLKVLRTHVPNRHMWCEAAQIEPPPRKKARLQSSSGKAAVTEQGEGSSLPRRITVKQETKYQSVGRAASVPPASSAPGQRARAGSEGIQHESSSGQRHATTTYLDCSTMSEGSSAPTTAVAQHSSGSVAQEGAQKTASGSNVESKGIRRVCAWCQYSRAPPHPTICFLRCREHRHPFYCVSDSGSCIQPTSEDRNAHDAIKTALQR